MGSFSDFVQIPESEQKARSASEMHRMEVTQDARARRNKWLSDQQAAAQEQASRRRIEQQAAAQREANQQFMDQYTQAGNLWQQAMMGDLSKAQSSLDQRKSNQLQGLGVKGSALQQLMTGGTQALASADSRQLAAMSPTSDMKQSRGALTKSVSSGPQANIQSQAGFLGQNDYAKNIVDSVLKTGQDQMNAAVTQTSDYLQKLYQMKGEEVSSFANESANVINTQRDAINQAQKQSEQQIIQNFAAMGQDANSPAVRNALVRSRQTAVGQLGSMASQIQTSYNDKAADILAQANSRIASFLPTSISAVQGSMESAANRGLSGLVQQASLQQTKQLSTAQMEQERGTTQAQLRQQQQMYDAGQAQQRQLALADQDKQVWSTMAQLDSTYNLNRTTMDLTLQQAQTAGLNDMAEWIANLDTNYVAWSPAMSQVMSLFIDQALTQQSMDQQNAPLYT